MKTKQKKTVEAQVVDIADKLTGASESLLEVILGNTAHEKVFSNYRKVLSSLSQHPIYPMIAHYAGLNRVTSEENITDLPRISLDFLMQGEEAFFFLQHKASLPRFFKVWFRDAIEVSKPGRNSIFSSWSDLINEHDIAEYLRYFPLMPR